MANWKGDVYITTRMFGGDAKVSLHTPSDRPIGNCRWAATEEWVKKEPHRLHSARRFVVWKTDRPIGTEAQHAFRVLIPESELRSLSTTEKLKDVQWFPEPPSGAAYAFDCYITPPVSVEPKAEAPPYLHIVSLPLEDQRWCVLLLSQVMVSASDLEGARAKMIAEMRSAGIEPEPEHRAAAFVGSNGLIELALLEEALPV